MAFTISSTEVISDDRALVNITGATGVYTNFHPSINTIVNNLDFDIPVMSLVMSANVTFTETNKAAGKSVLFLLDTSSNFRTPTFSSNIKWKNGTTPTWSSYRYWQIAFQCIDSTIVRGVALGYESTGGPAPTETINLTGTAGSYSLIFAGLTSFSGIKPGIIFGSDGILYEQLSNGTFPFSTGQWCNVTPSQTYYIRATLIEGQTPNAASDSLSTWLALSTSRKWEYLDTDQFGGYGYRSFVLKIEISTDSLGSTILDTGYYEIAWEGGA